MENEVKEPAPKYNFISPEQYLEMERASDSKHGYSQNSNNYPTALLSKQSISLFN